jgi:hypothetical protein
MEDFDYQIDIVEFTRLSSHCQSYYLSSVESAKLVNRHSVRSHHLVVGAFHSGLEKGGIQAVKLSGY